MRPCPAVARDWTDLFVTGEPTAAAGEQEQEQDAERKRGFFSRLRENMTKTRQALGADYGEVLQAFAKSAGNSGGRGSASNDVPPAYLGSGVRRAVPLAKTDPGLSHVGTADRRRSVRRSYAEDWNR